MYIWSEKLNRKFDTVKECEKAEREAEIKEQEEKAKREQLAEQKKARMKEIQDQFNKYADLFDKFCADYHEFPNVNVNMSFIGKNFRDIKDLFDHWFDN